jgi:hypothetical protein
MRYIGGTCVGKSADQPWALYGGEKRPGIGY